MILRVDRWKLKVDDDAKIRVPNGNIKSCCVFTMQLNQTNVMALGALGMVQRQQRTRRLCIFSHTAYDKLCSYIASMRTVAARTSASNALAMAIAIGMLVGALSTNDDWASGEPREASNSWSSVGYSSGSHESWIEMKINGFQHLCKQSLLCTLEN